LMNPSIISPASILKERRVVICEPDHSPFVMRITSFHPVFTPDRRAFHRICISH
jgi:hypothetical protein